MNLASFGCSFLYGYDGKGGCDKTYSTTYHLSKLMNRNWINKSDCGIGNDLIYERLITSHQRGDINPNDTFIVIGWTQGFRKKIFIDDEVYLTYRPDTDQVDNKELSYYLSNTNLVYYEVLKNIIGVYVFLENYGYDYLMLDTINTTMDECKIEEHYIPQELFDMKNEIKKYSKLNYYNWIQDKGDKAFISKSDHQPNQWSAEQFSKLLYSEITNE